MRRRFLFVLVVSLFSVMANSATIHVPADQPTIQAGIDAAVNGDTVLVAPGTYVESIDFNGKEIQVRSSQGPHSTIITNSDSIDLVHFHNGEDSQAVLEGFTLKGGNIGIRCENSGPTIIHNMLIDQKFTGWAAITLSGLDISIGWAPAHIINNTIVNAANGGISTFSSAAPIIKNNIIAFNANYGIHRNGDAIEPELSYNDVYGNSDQYAGISNPGVGSISLDPKFRFDFTLSFISPCINAGDPDTQFNDPDGSRNDMGALHADQCPIATDINFGDTLYPHISLSLIPVIAWDYYDATPSTQNQYEIEVGTDNDWNVSEMWVSGPVISSGTQAIYYGIPLDDHSTYYLRIRLNNGIQWGEWVSTWFFTHASKVINVPANVPTIQAGINLALDGDTVLVGQGTYVENISFLGKRIKLYSSGGAEVTTIQGNQLGKETVSFTNNEPKGTEIRGFTIKEGQNSGVYCLGSSTNIINNIITENHCGEGNVAGGIIMDNTLNSLIKNNLIYGNSGNSYTYGGAMHIGDGGTSSTNDTICYNVMYSNYGIANIRVMGNISGLSIFNNTMECSSNMHGLLYEGFGQVDSGQLDCRDNIIFKCPGIGICEEGAGVMAAEYNCLFNNGANFGGLTPGQGNIYENALFVDQANWNYALQMESPCINAGDPNPMYNDPDGSRNDMGAFPFILPAYPPILQVIGPKVALEGDSLRFRIYATDQNITIPELDAYLMPLNAIFIDSGNGAGGFYWQPPFGSVGQHQVLFIASDGILADSELVTITVNPAPPSVAAMIIDNSFPPVHLLNHTPPINWDFFDPGNDNPQTQFEIAVGTDSIWDIAEKWNPAPFASSDTNIIYAGDPLIDGATYCLRLRVNNGILWSNWFNIQFRMNSVPSIPSIIYPLDSGVVNSLQPTVRALKSSDLEDSYLLYDFEVITRGGQMAAHGYDIAGAGDTVRWQIPEDLSENEIYWWRIRSFDSYERSNWSSYQPFWVNATEEAPFAFELVGPPDTLGNKVFNMLPEFSWTESQDPDPRDSVRYTFYLAIDSNFQFVLTVDSLWNESYTHPDSLLFGTRYWWKVRATDKTGLHTNSTNTLNFRTWKLGDANGDWNLNALDVTFLINSLYKHGTKPNPLKVGDINGSCTINALDITYLINYLYKGGNAPKVGCE